MTEEMQNFRSKAWQMLKTQALPMLGLLLAGGAFMQVARHGGLLGMVLFLAALYGAVALYERRLKRKTVKGGDTTLES